jgi:hypothetical protein
MSISTERKILNLNKVLVKESISKWIEQDIIVPDSKPDALKIVNITVTPYINDMQVLDGGKVKITGRINYFVIYNVSDPVFNTRGLFMSYPYTETLNVEGITKESILNIVPITKNVIFSLPNERKISVKSEILFKIRAKTPVTINLITKFNTDKDIEYKIKECDFNNILFKKKSIIASKEDVMLPKQAEDFFEILKLDVKVINTEYKESYNKIMVKGDMDISLIYLSEDREDSFKRLNLQVPFSSMVELPSINENSKFDIKYEIQNFNLALNEEITTTKTFSLDYEIEVEVNMFEEQRIEYIEDFYSQSQDLRYSEESVELVKREVEMFKNIEVVENISNILSPNTRLIDYTLDVSNIEPTLNSNIVKLDGNAKISLLIFNLENMELENKTIDVLINEEFRIDDINQDTRIYLELKNSNINIIPQGNDLEVRIKIDVYSNIEDVIKLNLIDDIMEEKLDISDLDSMNIYIVKQGDTLWSIAKKYKTSIGKIAKINNIEDVNVLDKGQKILVIR